MKTIQVGFIGAGDVSIIHAEAVQRCSGANLKGLWNLSEAKGKEKCRVYGCSQYGSAEELVSDPDIDAVFVLTSLEAHHKYTMMALEAGKHVLVEKPVGVSVGEIEEMKAKADEKGLVCMPGHNYIYEPVVTRARELLDEGKLGKLAALYIMYHIQHPEEVAARFPGVIRQIMTHHAYIALYLAGFPASVSAMKSVIHYEEITQEDLAMATLKMKDDSLVHFTASFAADDHAGDPWTMMIKMIGTKGATRFSYRDWVENKRGVVHSQTYSAYPYSIYESDRHFIDACIRKGEQPLSTLEDAILAQKIVEGIEQSVHEKKHIEIS